MRLFPSQAWIRKGACELKPMDTFAAFHLCVHEEENSCGAAWLASARHSKGTTVGASWLESARQNKVGARCISGKEWLDSAPKPHRCGHVQTGDRLWVERRVLLTDNSDLHIRSKFEFAKDFGKEAEKYWASAVPEEAFGDWRMLWGKPINLLAFYKLHRRVSDNWVLKWESAPKWRSSSPCSNHSQAAAVAAWR